MNDEEKNKVLADAIAIAEAHLRDSEDHDLLVDYSLRYGLGKALEKHRGSPVDFRKETADQDMWDLIDHAHIFYKGTKDDFPLSTTDQTSPQSVPK